MRASSLISPGLYSLPIRSRSFWPIASRVSTPFCTGRMAFRPRSAATWRVMSSAAPSSVCLSRPAGPGTGGFSDGAGAGALPESARAGAATAHERSSPTASARMIGAF
jgi:hypothetical protein